MIRRGKDVAFRPGDKLLLTLEKLTFHYTASPVLLGSCSRVVVVTVTAAAVALVVVVAVDIITAAAVVVAAADAAAAAVVC